MLNKTVSVWERRGNLGLDIAKSRARLRGDRKKKKKKIGEDLCRRRSRQRSLGHNSTFDRGIMRRWLSILAWKSNSLVRNLGPYYEGNLLERLQITIFPSYAGTDDRFTSETGIIVGGTASHSAWLLLHVDEGKRAKSAVSRRCEA